jgi:hypothetical protein
MAGIRRRPEQARNSGEPPRGYAPADTADQSIPDRPPSRRDWSPPARPLRKRTELRRWPAPRPHPKCDSPTHSLDFQYAADIHLGNRQVISETTANRNETTLGVNPVHLSGIRVPAKVPLAGLLLASSESCASTSPTRRRSREPSHLPARRPAPQPSTQRQRRRRRWQPHAGAHARPTGSLHVQSRRHCSRTDYTTVAISATVGNDHDLSLLKGRIGV